MGTILVVDDVATNRQLLVTVLSAHGHRVIEAVDGSAGLAAAKAEQPDLVITDVLMPVMDGHELVRQLRLDPATCNTPIAFYTANYSERESRELALSGVVSYVITKPLVISEVLDVVNRALEGRSEREIPISEPVYQAVFDAEQLPLATSGFAKKDSDLKAANARLRALINIGLEIAPELDFDRMLETVCLSAQDVFGATYVTMGVVDPEDGLLRRLIVCGTEASEWIKAGDSIPGILETSVSQRRTVRAQNAGGAPEALKLPSLHPEIQNFLVAPLTSLRHVHGWICLVQNEDKPFSADDEYLLRALAGKVGRIYENGYSYAVAQSRTTELEHEVRVRKQAETALRAERDRSQRYIDAAQTILLVLDRKGRITLMNRYGSSVLGWQPDELIGRDWFDTCVPAANRGWLEQLFRGALDGRATAAVENSVVTRSGEERTIEWRNTLLRDDAGQVVGTLSSGTDITDRNRAAEAVRKAEERMRFVLESADVGIWDIDFRANALEWSDVLCRQYGIEPGTFGGTLESFVECIYPEDREVVVQTISNAMKSGDDFTVQHRGLRPDGTIRWLTGSGRILLDDNDEPVRGVGISLDVTGQRNLEEQYNQAQKMEAIGQLAGGVAHDFNNLLTAILGYCEFVLRDLEPGTPSWNDVAEIQKTSVIAADLTRRLLAFSRKQMIELTVLDLNSVVADMQAMLSRLIGAGTPVILETRATSALVKADRGQIEQIVLNLAVNARDAMPTGGTLMIRTANRQIYEIESNRYALEPGAYVVLTVTDTGTGIPAAAQSRLFEPFFTTKGPGQGTGLGLSTVHGIAIASGGGVDFTTESGKGTSFNVYLPVAEAGAKPAARNDPPIGLHDGGQTVLVVDDAENLRRLTARLLEREGYVAVIGANAKEAIDLFERNPSVEVLLTDVVMQGGSGPELAKQLRERRPDLKVIFMSGYTDQHVMDGEILSRDSVFLQKPFTSETLAEKLREVLGR